MGWPANRCGELVRLGAPVALAALSVTPPAAVSDTRRPGFPT
jgi:hypothetical protein